jgi:hypothetical protein
VVIILELSEKKIDFDAAWYFIISNSYATGKGWGHASSGEAPKARDATEDPITEYVPVA